MSERDKAVAWTLAIVAIIGMFIWLSTQPPTPGSDPCVTQGHDYAC